MKTFNLAEENSLLHRFVAELRNVNIQNDSMRFRCNIERIGEIMAYEISKTLDYKVKDIQTPLGIAPTELEEDKVVLATILRAGLPMHHGFLNYFDRAENAFVSAYRKYIDEEHFDIHMGYLTTPDLTDKTLVIIDPMLATGSSMEIAYEALQRFGKPKSVHIASVIASKPALKYLEEHLPEEVSVWVAALDDTINSHSYIVPGLGDAGDLAYGHKLDHGAKH